jgi:hypothetical protein
MPREIEARGLIFSLRHAPCAHICRYCLVSETRKGSKLPFAQFERLLHRFHDWKDSGQTDISIRTFIGPSFDYDIDTLKGVARLRARRGNPFEIMNLGGSRMRDAEALKVWLDERQAAGIVGFHTPRSPAATPSTTAGTAKLAISTTRFRSCAWPANAAWCARSGSSSLRTRCRCSIRRQRYFGTSATSPRRASTSLLEAISWQTSERRSTPGSTSHDD